ncbi:MAG: hypothetical protein KME07_22215 [Pegethrix bostrychoides GSE-TBD4-15B]|jgi:hypothetical protein|uniref:Uncharacterized protein n=1 Tax=Pegethrix bostrychoides GSE-TBD4-15B TaxID=2839662 RepID=A0A951U731_9CYAN|nr:hypothetical protein [Pegethrix bostrychoides GSE-TBD4-15B]
MLFQFPPLVEAGLAAGKYAQVFNAAGVPLGLARDSATGQFVGNAVGIVRNNGVPFNPITTPVQLGMNGAQMYQVNQGFQATQAGIQSLQTSLSVLQATTAVIGVGVAANLAISAVSLRQILKLREDVKHLRLEVKEGFFDLKKAFSSQGAEIIRRIEEVAKDIKFEQHRLILIQAYGKFLEATRLLKVAMLCDDLSIRNTDLANAKQTLMEALADYRNPHLLEETCAAGQLRRLECAWVIEQTIALIYQLQNEPEALSHCLAQLQERILTDALAIVDRCESEQELNLLFPEITRVHDQDLAVLSMWQNQVDWLRLLPQSELQLLQSADFSHSKADASSVLEHLEIPSEQTQYEDLQSKSHPDSLQDQLRFLLKPELRSEPETYISQQATQAGHKALTASNLNQMSNMAVANLYWYFKVRDEPEAV